jgi:hypothetical protein
VVVSHRNWFDKYLSGVLQVVYFNCKNSIQKPSYPAENMWSCLDYSPNIELHLDTLRDAIHHCLAAIGNHYGAYPIDPDSFNGDVAVTASCQLPSQGYIKL